MKNQNRQNLSSVLILWMALAAQSVARGADASMPSSAVPKIIVMKTEFSGR